MNFLAAVLISVQPETTHLQPKPYHEAYQEAMKNGRPLLVVIGAKWCHACRQLEEQTVPEVTRNGGFRGIEVAFVDVDRDAIAKKLLSGTRIPQIVRFDRSPSGRWKVQRLSGFQSGHSLGKFAQSDEPVGTNLLADRHR